MAILAFMVFLLMDARIESLWIIIPLVLIYLALLVIFSVRIKSGFYVNAFYKGNTNEKIVALTFDDGPDAGNTSKILDILEKYHVPATFFIIGRKAEEQQELLKLIISKGHRLGNHSYGHDFFFDFFGRKKMEQDLLKAGEIILKATGKRPLLFRPPYGVTNPVVAKVVKKLGYSVIGWSVRSFDTTTKDAEKVAARVIKRLHPGAVILMHDTQDVTAEALEKMILKILEEGYRLVGLEELSGIKAYKN
jgi:peptidoglycan/xylan/chitin deacetylase (PgdA/CDA1 family)